jgi:hypothetical protein
MRKVLILGLQQLNVAGRMDEPAADHEQSLYKLSFSLQREYSRKVVEWNDYKLGGRQEKQYEYSVLAEITLCPSMRFMND